MPTNQFQDSWYRIESAYKEYDEFRAEVDKAIYSQMQRMIGLSPDNSNDTVIQLLTRKELIELASRPSVLAGQISENLRSALDYIVYWMSERNDPNLNKRLPAFVIADDSASFQGASGSGLRYLTQEQKDIVEGLQPYLGHVYLRLVRDASNSSKHRGLLTLRNSISSEVVLDSTANAGKYKDYWRFPQSNGATVYVKRNYHDVVFLEVYDAVAALKYMIEGTRAVAWAFEHYLVTGKFPTFHTGRKHKGRVKDYSATVDVTKS